MEYPISVKLINRGPRVLQAVFFGRAAHDSIGQVRKYSGEPYWMHTERVAVSLIDAGVDDDDMIIAALLHDVDEDVYPKNKYYSLALILNYFGIEVAKMVHDLTDVYTKEAFPGYNRKERHTQEYARLQLIQEKSKVIKAADIGDNTENILIQDPKFGKIYLGEKKELIKVLFPLSNSDYQKKVEFILDESTAIGKYLPRH